MANDLEVLKRDIYQGESFFRDIVRTDGQAFSDTMAGTYEVRDSLNKKIDEGSMLLSVPKTEFELRFYNTSDWEIGKEYRLLARIADPVTHYNDVVLEVTFTVK